MLWNVRSSSSRSAFTLIELLVVIAIIAILAVVVVLTLNPAELLRQSRDANRVSDIATLTSALNLYTTDQSGVSTFSLGNASNTALSVYDPTASTTCGGLGLPAWNTGSGQAWQCATSSTYRNVTNTGWIPVNLNAISSGSPLSNLPVDPVNQTSSSLFYGYNTNGSQFVVTANLESAKYKAQYGTNLQTPYFPEVISGGTPSVSALYNPTGLVGYWPLNEGSGTLAYDQSGNGNNGTWNGSTTAGSYYTGGKVGLWAGTFNGVNDYIDAGNASALKPSQITVAFWQNESAAQTAGCNVVSRGNLNYNSGYFITLQGGSFQGRFSNGTGFDIVTASNQPIVGTWNYFTAVGSATATQLYINGKLVSSATRTGPLNYTTGDTDMMIDSSLSYVPTYISGSWQPCLGTTNEVRVYNRALSAAEIQALYNAEK